MSDTSGETPEKKPFAFIEGDSVAGDGPSDARRFLDAQIKAQLEVSRHFRIACGKVSEKLFSDLKVRLTEAPTPDDHGAFEANARLEAADGKAIAECRVFTGINGVAYFVAGAEPPEELAAPTPEQIEAALTAFSERALKSKAA